MPVIVTVMELMIRWCLKYLIPLKRFGAQDHRYPSFDIDEAGGFTFAMPSSEPGISVGGSFSSFNTFQIDGQDVVPVDQFVMGVDGGELFSGFGASAEQNFLQTDLNKWISKGSDFLYGTSHNGGFAESYVLLDGANTKAVYVDTKQLADNSSSNWFSYKQMGESAVLYHTTSNSGPTDP